MEGPTMKNRFASAGLIKNLDIPVKYPSFKASGPLKNMISKPPSYRK